MSIFEEYKQIDKMGVSEVVNRIINLTDEMKSFWSSARGWAPIEAADLLTKSRLDRQVSLSKMLSEWVTEPLEEDEIDGRLIVAWANMGALVEGIIKWFLSIYLKDLKKDDKFVYGSKPVSLKSPEGEMLDRLIQFCRQKSIFEDKWLDWADDVRQKRNAIHAFKDKDIGTFKDLYDSFKIYLEFLRHFNGRVPYPDDITPKEIEY